MVILQKGYFKIYQVMIVVMTGILFLKLNKIDFLQCSLILFLKVHHINFPRLS